MMNKYIGNDNFGQPKQLYLNKLSAMTDNLLRDECESKIWLSAYAANNSRSDYHWQCTACYDECVRRGKESIYERAYKYVAE